MPAPNEITPKQLLRLIGLPDAPFIVDVCLPEDFEADPVLVPTALRIPYSDLDTIMQTAEGRAVVVICQKGLKLSQGVASRLRARGVAAEYLAGGMIGWRAGAETPAIPFATLPSSSLWVTRHRPKIDRIACPWLIRRFVDPKAEFLYVAPDQVTNVAERFGATPFDVAEVPFSHHDGQCTFDALLDHFALSMPALDRLAAIVRAADTGRNDEPQAAGLLALSVGLSRQYRDDHQQLAAALPLYDALYRWARDGSSETHSSFGGQS